MSSITKTIASSALLFLGAHAHHGNWPESGHYVDCEMTSAWGNAVLGEVTLF